MSKIVILNSVLAAPHIAKDALKRLAIANPAVAKWVEEFDAVPLIREAAMKAVENMKNMEVSISSTLEDYYGKSFSKIGSDTFLAVLKTPRIPKGMALIMMQDGTIKFATDDVNDSSEIRRLKEMFQSVFLQECIKMFLGIMGYEFTVATSPMKDSETGLITQNVYIKAEK